MMPPGRRMPGDRTPRLSAMGAARHDEHPAGSGHPGGFVDESFVDDVVDVSPLDVKGTVDAHAIAAHDFGAWAVDVGPEPRRVVGREEHRRSILLVNNSASAIYVGPSSGVSAPNGGGMIPAGAGVHLNTQAEVYAVSLAAGPLRLDVFVERN